MQQLLQQLGVSQAEILQIENMFVAALILTLVSILLTLWLAHRRGLNMPFWTVMVLVFGPLALPFVFFGKPKKGASKPASEIDRHE